MKLISYIFVLIIGVIWGSEFIFNEIAIRSIPPISTAAGRAIVGAITLTIMLQFNPRASPIIQSQIKDVSQLYLWQQFFIIALFEATIPFFLLAWGQQRIDSNHAAIFMSTIPILTTVLAKFLIPGTVLGLSSLISIFLGFAGMVVLVGPVTSLSVLGNVSGGLAVLGAALCFSLALILIKKLAVNNPMRSARNLLFCASMQLIPLSLLFDQSWRLQPSIEGLLSVLMLGSLCGGVASMLYFAVIEYQDPTFAAFINYLVPLFAALFGMMFLHEVIKLSTVVAFLIIISATVMNGLDGAK
ncbi:MAG: DMT family transporter [Stigonema ocellatum SAG 48.90 = DSM 106950]|nr:DMT family transporter [Stigonema ocellatum SAG 48.90 = DSM 106950]